MARIAGSSGEKTLAAIHRAALKRIYQRGYEAMTLRQVAADVGIQAASLYNHIASKQDLLFTLLDRTMDDLATQVAAATEGTVGPMAALKAFIAFHIGFHTERRMEVFIGNMELRSLDPANYAAIVAKRGAYQARLRRILEDGNTAGVWRVEDPQVATYAVIAMLTGICTWYTPSGRLPKDALTRLYTEQVLHGLNPREEAA